MSREFSHGLLSEVSYQLQRAYCTYFNSGYLSRGLSMIASLRAVGEHGPVVVLALDDQVAAELRAHVGPNIEIVRLEAIEEAFPELREAKENRSRMEYLFTLTPWLTRYTMELLPEAVWATYLDADLYFYSSVEPIYDELQSGSVGIIPHRFPPGLEWREKYGRYNVGWVSFRSDPDGRTCLGWWADRCLEWCYDRPEDGRFADQGYLDSFADTVATVVVVEHPGADTAPWNLAGHGVSRDERGAPLVDDSPLIFFHFHGLSRDGNRFRFNTWPYGVRVNDAIRDGIYRPYATRLAALDGPAGMTSRDRQRSGLSLGGRLSNDLRTWLADRRGDYVDV